MTRSASSTASASDESVVLRIALQIRAAVVMMSRRVLQTHGSYGKARRGARIRLPGQERSAGRRFSRVRFLRKDT